MLSRVRSMKFSKSLTDAFKKLPKFEGLKCPLLYPSPDRSWFDLQDCCSFPYRIYGANHVVCRQFNRTESIRQHHFTFLEKLPWIACHDRTLSFVCLMGERFISLTCAISPISTEKHQQKRMARSFVNI